LLLLGHDYTDECHDIVLALSWPSTLDITYNGHTEFHQASKEVRAYASYVHCMVHRKEAFHIGEFGMKGIDNANFWSNQVKQSGGEDKLPQDELRKKVQVLAKEYDDGKEEEEIQEWCDRIVQENGSNINHRAIHDLAMTVLKRNTKGSNNSSDSNLQKFAEQVIESEMRILLFHALQKAGFDTENADVFEREKRTEL
jgi:hypothetical protein